MEWNYFNKFEAIIDQYMSPFGEGETMASQIVTATNKLIYKWYNDGDVFDNTYAMPGWWNDLSSYANWLYKYTNEDVRNILVGISDCSTDEDYEDLLAELANTVLNEEFLEKFSTIKAGTIYECDGPFKFIEVEEVEEDEDDEDDEWEDDEEEEE